MLRLIQSVYTLWEASDQLEKDAPSPESLDAIISAGIIRPGENESLGFWFARFLSVRQGLWEVIDDALAAAGENKLTLSDDEYWRLFVVGYSAACLLIRNDRFLLFKIATHSIIQRKFNEAIVEYRIPPKQYTMIFSAYVDGADVMRIFDAVEAAKKNRLRLLSLREDTELGRLASALPLFESWVDTSKRSYARKLCAYVSHIFRRRGVVTLSRALAKVMERCGRAASELNLPLEKRLTPALREEFRALLKPGDILITRHDTALTNLFLPGFWPHAALYIGTEKDREKLGVMVDEDRASRWSDECCVLEALKDGVHFRSLSSTLAVDNAVLLRPQLADADIAASIERVVQHEGKLYNFDFDFFNAEKLVCTEVVYRAYDGIGGLVFPLTERAGRHTLSAEDLLDYAFSDDGIVVEAVFGLPGASKNVVTGEQARRLVLGSYESAAAATL